MRPLKVLQKVLRNAICFRKFCSGGNLFEKSFDKIIGKNIIQILGHSQKIKVNKKIV